MTDEILEDLAQEEERVRNHLEGIVADLITILCSDLLGYPSRELRKRFISNSEFAEKADDDQIVSMKKKAATAGKKLSESAKKKFSDNMEFWFGESVPQGHGKTFSAHTNLVNSFGEIDKKVDSLLSTFGFPTNDAGNFDLNYALPPYFVKGMYAPGLTETFWKNLSKLSQLRESRKEQDVGRRRSIQRQRWDVAK
jgi:hypothetical protein